MIFHLINEAIALKPNLIEENIMAAGGASIAAMAAQNAANDANNAMLTTMKGESDRREATNRAMTEINKDQSQTANKSMEAGGKILSEMRFS
ncbi:hypothetical protein BGP75_24045 [Motiliproteus sp. MSK22-1]|nr:hypothetical protein BGP75_24045 [Motiliproteus sp. MSK22-1]